MRNDPDERRRPGDRAPEVSAQDDTLSELVAACLAQQADGEEEVTSAAICAEICVEHPHLLDEVTRIVENAARLPIMHQRGGSSDRMVRSLVAGRYRVRARIGSGAMGVVYSATDLDLGREVALKVLHGSLLDRTTAMARFDREASALASIQHESVVTIHDRGVTEDGSPFLVMELIEGVPCSKILERAKALGVEDDNAWLDEACGITATGESSFLRQAVRWMSEVASGLSAAHQAGVYHRDVKPSNIIIRPDGRAVLLDFGIAATDEQESLTRSDAAVGTPAYMAPEMLKGAQKASPAQDIYGVAATLYHCVTLEPPYSGSSSEVLTAAATREPIPAFKIRPGLPKDAQAILDHGLHRSPSHRYASVQAMEADLRALLAFRPVSVRPTSTVVRAVRRVSRSKLFIGVALASLTIFLGLSANESIARARTEALARRTSNFKSAWPGVPTNFPAAMGGYRGIASEELRRVAERAFDGLVASGHQACQALILRAIFRLDHGDLSGAQQDIGRFDRLSDSDFSRELSKRYAVAESGDPQEAIRINLSGLPEPSEAADLYASTMHALRKDGSENFMSDPRLDDVRHIQALRLIFKVAEAQRKDSIEQVGQRNRLLEATFEAARQILESSEYDGATLLHVMACARGFQGRFSDCLELSRDVLRHAPASPATLQNAGETARKLMLFDEARALIERGLVVTPGYLKMERTLALTEAGAGQYDRARAIATSAHFGGSEQADFHRAELMASIQSIEAYQLFQSEEDGARAAATRLLNTCETLSESSRSRPIYQALGEGILEDDTAKFSQAVLKLLMREPTSTRLVGVLAGSVPQSIDAPHAALLQAWLFRLHLKLAQSSIVPPSDLARVPTSR